MSMNPVPRELSEEDQKLIDKFLKNKGEVQKIKSGVTTYTPENNIWNQKNPKNKSKQE